MTSKSLCFRLMREDLKRRVWTIALTFLGFIFTILVPTAIKCSEFMEESAAWNYSVRQRMAANVVELLGANGMAVCVLLAAGVLWAVSGFHYLHNSKKVDFYHSIPVKRRTLFLSVYLDGILVPGLIYLLMQVLSTALAVHAKVGINHIGMIPVQFYVLNMVYYSMLYTTAVLAMMMTGNVVIALLGDLVFWAYGPAVAALRYLYYQWFHTFYETEEGLLNFSRMVRYSSPFADYMYALQILAEGEWRVVDLIGAAAVTAALAVLAFSLYKIRPSEAARKAMAFPKTEMPIKVLLTIPTALAFGMFFQAIRDKAFWLVFGTVFGALLIHCMMEIIYHFDFRKLFHNRVHLGLCMAVAVLLSLAGYYDWYGYDSWLPDPAKVSDAAVIMGYQDNWVTYGGPRKDTVTDLDTGEERDYYSWMYGSGDQYAFEHMKVKDIYSVMEAAKKGVRACEVKRKNAYDSVAFEAEEWERWVICFRMNNGKVVYRTYSIPMDEEMTVIRDTIHDSVEYKQGLYPILTQTASDTVKASFQQYDKQQPLDLDYEQLTRLLNVYQKEFEGLTMDTRRKELPMGTIQFMTREHYEACSQEKDKRYYGMWNRCYYPVYPSFTRTLELLKEAGATWTEIREDTVSSIAIYYDNIDYGALQSVPAQEMEEVVGKELVYEESEDIKELVPALAFQDYFNYNSFYEADMVNYLNVAVTLTEEDGENGAGEAGYRGEDVTRDGSLRFCLDKSKLSEEEMKKYHFDLYEMCGLYD